MKWLFTLIGLALAVANIRPVYAHADLIDSNPAANAILETAPEEIHLWFTERLEPRFSHIEIRNAADEILDLPDAEVIGEGTEMVLRPGDLPDGSYVIAWQVVSQADGHRTRGTIPFAIGAPTVPFPEAPSEEKTPIPVESAVIRWLNMISLAIPTGGTAFILWVWLPLGWDDPTARIRLQTFMLVGWLMLGLTTVLLLLLQASIATDQSLLQVFHISTLKPIITESRFGELWQFRVLLWVILVLALIFARYRSHFWLILLIGAGLAYLQSLGSHASGVADQPRLAILSDWLHLMAMALWLGGLLQFLNLLPIIRKQQPELLAQGVAYFSNYARLSVLVLILTGVYAAWLQVGSFTALTSTDYGRALIIKLLLLMPLLVLAAINLLLTAKKLQENNFVWGTRLQRLVILEIVLLVGILAAVGVMTAISPAHSEYAMQERTEENKQTAPRPVEMPVFESDTPIQVVISHSTDLPYLITQSGQLWEASETGQFQVIPAEFTILSAYIDSSNLLWAGSDTGLYRHENDQWQQVSDIPVQSMIETHGYLYALGKGSIVRVEVGQFDPAKVRVLDAPASEPADALLMLGNHTHTLLTDNHIFQSSDLGLSWLLLDIPAPLANAALDRDENLLGFTSEGILQWDVRTRRWTDFADLPDNNPVEAFVVFNAKYYALAAGKLYVKVGQAWQLLEIDAPADAYFTALVFEYPDTLWALDARNHTLWSTKDGAAWHKLEIALSAGN